MIGAHPNRELDHNEEGNGDFRGIRESLNWIAAKMTAISREGLHPNVFPADETAYDRQAKTSKYTLRCPTTDENQTEKS